MSLGHGMAARPKSTRNEVAAENHRTGRPGREPPLRPDPRCRPSTLQPSIFRAEAGPRELAALLCAARIHQEVGIGQPNG